MKRSQAIRPVILLLLAAAALPAQAQTGGGYCGAGIRGEYFANPDLRGEPAFVRRDVRVDFDWGALLPVGGSTAEPYASFPTDGFSVRWTGQVIPRFSEDYAFKADADEDVRVRLRSEGASDWTTLADSWDRQELISAVPARLAAGRKYDLVVEYRDRTGPARCRLLWSCPSAGEEVIDVITANALNASSWHEYMWADFARLAGWAGGVELDADGWPESDADLSCAHGRENMAGTYLLQFTGRAEVGVGGARCTFVAGGQEHAGALPDGAGYDEATNTTRALMKMEESSELTLKFTNTRRTPDAAPNTGVTGVKLLRPTAPGSDTPHDVTENVYRPVKDAFGEHYTCLRWLQVANQRNAARWEERTRPGYMGFVRGGFWGDNSGGECWELLVMLANETGKDLYLTTPVQAGDDYFRKLALLLKNGSDGTEPYPSPQQRPKYPPLNPNLRVYVEVGNEIWNWGFGSTQDANSMAEEAKKAGTGESKVFSYNGQGNYRTWHALRTVRCSDIFRSVFGDAAMGGRVRMLIEYQYNNAQATAWNSLRFLDGYFNNGTGDHVADPHPVNYYIWGAGGATYYGTGNRTGDQEELVLADAGFGQPEVPAFTAQVAPVSPAWKFSGPAGIYRNYHLAANAARFGKPTRLTKNAVAGCRLRVGDRPLFVYELGRWIDASHDGSQVWLLKAADMSVVARASIERLPSFLKHYGYHFGKATRDGVEGPVRLEPNTEYLLLTANGNASQSLYGGDTAVTPGPGLTVTASVRGMFTGQAANPSGWQVRDVAEGAFALGPVNLHYALSEGEPTEFPSPGPDAQAAFLRSGGEISQTLDFPVTGAFALTFNAAGSGVGWPGHGPFDIFADDVKISPRSQGDHRVSRGTSGLAGFHRRTGEPRENWGSAVFQVKEPGPHTIRFVGRGKPEDWVILDNIRIASVDAIMESGFGSGEALGQVAQDDYRAQLDAQAGYARVFGLNVVAYEAGWSLGGDFHARPIQTYCKFVDERARRINNTAMDIFTESGGFMNVWGVYIYFPDHDIVGAANYPLMRSLQDLNNRLPAEADNGIPVPATLTPETIVRWLWSDGNFKGEMGERGQWASWLIVCPGAGAYAVTVEAGPGGSFEVEADGRRIGSVRDSGAAAGSPFPVRLGKGMHGIRVRNTGGSFTLERVLIAPQPAP